MTAHELREQRTAVLCMDRPTTEQLVSLYTIARVHGLPEVTQPISGTGEVLCKTSTDEILEVWPDGSTQIVEVLS